jgi:hypothetical protein
VGDIRDPTIDDNARVQQEGFFFCAAINLDGNLCFVRILASKERKNLALSQHHHRDAKISEHDGGQCGQDSTERRRKV